MKNLVLIGIFMAIVGIFAYNNSDYSLSQVTSIEADRCAADMQNNPNLICD